MKWLMFILVAITGHAALLMSESTMAAIIMPSGNAPCAKIVGGAAAPGVGESGDSCAPLASAYSTYYFGFGQVFGAATTAASALDAVFVPYTGKWKIRVHICELPQQSHVQCTMGYTNETFDAPNIVSLISTENINGQNPDFGGYAEGIITVPNNRLSTLCYTLYDPDHPEQEYGRPAGYVMCPDAAVLPLTPAECSINLGNALDVDLGTLKRHEIAVNASSGAAGNIMKTVPVRCTRDAGTTVKTKFQFTSISVNGNDVISTSSKNLGVAIIYKNKIASPADEFIDSFSAEENNTINLEFEAVRDPNVALQDIPVGDFTAHVVMIMTEQ